MFKMFKMIKMIKMTKIKIMHKIQYFVFSVLLKIMNNAHFLIIIFCQFAVKYTKFKN
jgi:hypothetical protein